MVRDTGQFQGPTGGSTDDTTEESVSTTDDQAGQDDDPLQQPGTGGGSAGTPSDDTSDSPEPSSPTENDDQAGRDDDPFQQPGTGGGSGGSTTDGSDDPTDGSTDTGGGSGGESTSDDGGSGSDFDYSDRVPTEDEMTTGPGETVDDTNESGSEFDQGGSPSDELQAPDGTTVDTSDPTQVRDRDRTQTDVDTSNLDFQENTVDRTPGPGTSMAGIGLATQLDEALDERYGRDVNAEFTTVGDDAVARVETGDGIEYVPIALSSDASEARAAAQELQTEYAREQAESRRSDLPLFSGDRARFQQPDGQSVAEANAERRREAGAQDIARGNLGDPQEIAAESATQQLGFEVTERDISNVQATGGGVLQYSLSPSVATAAAFEQQSQQGPGSVDVQRTQDGGFDVDLSGPANASEIEGDLDDDLQQRVEASQRQQAGGREEVADFDWSLGLGDPDEDEVENAIDSAAASYSNTVRGVSQDIFGEGGPAGQSAGEEILTAAGYPGLGDRYERNLRSGAQGLFQGAAEIGNVPGIAGGLMEAGEAAGYAGVELAQGDSEEVKQQTVRFGSRVYEQAEKNPIRTGGLLAGSLAGSAGAFRTARAVGPRASRATRAVIQPGEEALGSVGSRVTRRVAGQGAAQRYFPNNEPIFFSEETAIRGAKGVARRAQRTRERLLGGGRAGSTLELQGSPRQRELIQRFRPRSSTDELGQEGVVAAQSEPLGSNTESILDATVGNPQRIEATTETEADTDSTSQVEVNTETEAQDNEPQVTAQMQAAASDAQGRSELAAAMEEFGVRVDEFAADTRGRADLTFGGRSRGRSDTDTTSPGGELQDDRVTANLYQQAVDRQVQAEYDVLEGGSGRRSGRDFGERAGRREVEAERPRGERVRQDAERPRVQGDTRGNQAARRVEATLTDQRQDSDVQASEGLLRMQMALLGSQGRLGTRTGTRSGLDVTTRGLLDFESETRVGTETDQEVRQGVEQRQTLERRRRQNRLEANTQREFETEGRVEGERRDDDDQTFGLPSVSGSASGGSSGASRGIAAGWLNEFVTGLALGPGTRQAPSRQALNDGDGSSLSEQRPTQVMLSGTDAEQERIQEAQDFLLFGGDSDTDSGGGGLL